MKLNEMARINIELVQDMMWAIHPAKLDEIDAVIRRLLEGERGLGDFAAQDSASVSNKETSDLSDIAVINVFGTLMKRANLFSRWSGGTSYQIVRSKIEEALGDEDVRGILLYIDSPGGAVDGVFELTDFIFESRGRKPIVAFSDGMMASAAQLIASAAEHIVIGKATLAGSIGVVMTHYDFSERDKQMGIVRTEIYSGKYKRIASELKPLSKEGRDYLQSRTDTFYSLFVETVARNYGVSVEKVLADMADGKVFVGAQAFDVGLVNQVGTFDDAVLFIRKRETNMNEMEKKLKALEEKLNASAETIEKLEARAKESEKVAAELKARLKDEQKRAAKAEAEKRKAELSTKVDNLVAAFKMAPHFVEGGFKEILSVIDSVQVGEKSAADALIELFDQNPGLIVSAVEHFASSGPPAGSNLDLDGVEHAKEIAEIANVGVAE